jgi:hypothetical protein
MSTTAGYPSLRASGKCAASGRDLVPGEHYVATLIEHVPNKEALKDSLKDALKEVAPKEVFARLDYSQQAWEAGHRPHAPIVGVWRTTYTPVDAHKPKPIMGDQEMLDLFEELGPTGDAKQSRFRYLLSLLLIRRRLLRVTANRRTPEGPIMSVVRRGENSGQIFDVLDPGMDETSVAEALEQLGLLADGESAPPQNTL